MQIIETSHGLPYGSYDILFYSATASGVRRLAACDREVDDQYVRSLSVRRREVAVATCRSQPGGATIYGSEAARAIWVRDRESAL